MSDTKIHPTAIVDPDAKIAASVEIGPFSIIGPHATIGENTIVQSHVVIEGTVTIGRRNFVGHGCPHRRPAAGSFLFARTKNESRNRGRQRHPRVLHDPPRQPGWQLHEQSATRIF